MRVWAWELQLVASRAGQAIRGWTVDGRMRKIQVLWRNGGGHAHAQWSPRLSSIDELEQSTRVRLSSCELRAFTRATTPRAGTGPHRPDDGRAKGTRRPKPIINDDRKETTRATASQQLYNFFFYKIYYRILKVYNIYYMIFKNAYSMNDTENIVISCWTLYTLSYDIWHKRREK